GAAPGGSSIAVFVMDQSKGTLRRSHLIAGNGADGDNGKPGHDNGEPAQAGLDGLDGTNACTMAPKGLGGASLNLQCDNSTSSISGYGGNGSDISANPGADGELAPSPNPLGYGAGGQGEDAAQGTACTGGAVGAQGIDGMDGSGAAGNGQLNENGHVI